MFRGAIKNFTKIETLRMISARIRESRANVVQYPVVVRVGRGYNRIYKKRKRKEAQVHKQIMGSDLNQHEYILNDY